MSINPQLSDIQTVIIEKGAGTSTLVAAVSGKQIVVLGYAFTVSKDGSVKFKDSSGGRAKFRLPENGGAVFAGNVQCPAFKCAEGKALEIENSSELEADGHLAYILA